jgi:hypothetical protein
MNTIFTSAIKLSLIPAGLLVEPIFGFLSIMLHSIYIYVTLYKNLCSTWIISSYCFCMCAMETKKSSKIYAHAMKTHMMCHNFCAHAMEIKMSSKICIHAMKTFMICHNYWIYHKNRICMHAPCVFAHGPVVGRFLCYLCGLFTLFLWTIYTICAKNRTIIYGLCLMREVGCWTGSLTDARAWGWPGHGRGDTLDSLTWGVGGHVGAAQPDRGWSARASSNIWKLRASNIPSLYIRLRN